MRSLPQLRTVTLWVIAVIGPTCLTPSPRAHGNPAELVKVEVPQQPIAVEDLQVVADGRPVTAITSESTGFVLIADGDGPQVAILAHAGALVTGVRQGEVAEVRIPIAHRAEPLVVSARIELLEGEAAEVEFGIEGAAQSTALHPGRESELRVEVAAAGTRPLLSLITRGVEGEVAVRWREIRIQAGTGSEPAIVAFQTQDPHGASCPPPQHPPLRPAIEQMLIEWDWRMQDGIGTPRDSVSYAEAINRTFDRGDQLMEDLRRRGLQLAVEEDEWGALRARQKQFDRTSHVDESDWERLWRAAHKLRRRIALKNPLAITGPLVFVQDVPGGAYSSHIVSFHGDSARPGGGVFVLEEPGRSMRVRPLVRDQLPQGAYMHPEVCYDGRRVLFAYAPVESDPTTYGQFPDRHFHLYSIDADGNHLSQLTDGPYDDHSPCVLPNGQIVFISTRRGGFHRCGQGPCPTHTLALCEHDGSNPRVISFHETHEYDPVVLHDGRVLYTRWDYVDRRAVNFQHLWTVKPDGSDVRIYYGNGTLNPMGIWEARPIAGSHLLLGTACGHHSMPAGSLVLVDVRQGVDDLEPLTRFTPDVPFYESEFPLYSPAGGLAHWPSAEQLQTIRWPGHCYRTPYPLAEDHCLAAYTFETLRGEPYHNTPNLFGLYLLDRFGNQELLYRNLNISSSWPIPLRSRNRPPALPSSLADDQAEEGTFFVRNVYASWTPLPAERIARLRITQVLPKTTPHAENPPPGAGRQGVGRQVLGTVPVEEDGSAYFRVPARKAVAFEALDEHGRAVQTMYSLTYLQPGEQASCVGCHEHTTSVPPHADPHPIAQALRRSPSDIAPGPDGSYPFSYPLLVQPVLDQHCTRCHRADAPTEQSGGIVLTGEPEGDFSRSYNALIRHVAFRNSDGPPKSSPNQYGARGSRLNSLLRDGHHHVELSPQDWERLITWMDTNAVFFGTFDRTDQARQLRGERIEGPELE